MVGEILAAVLQMEGYKTNLFTDPAEAARYVAEGSIRPDLIVADYAMAPLNGLELIERCREVLPELPSILCSGACEDLLADSAIRPTAYLSKPFLPREMIKTVRRILDAAAGKESSNVGAAVLSN